MTSLGNIEPAGLWLGQLQTKSAWLGDKEIWSSEQPAPTGDWLCLTAEKANSTVKFNKYGSPDPITIETSTDGNVWTDYSWSGSNGSTLTLANIGDKVYMRAKTQNQTLGKSLNDFYNFVMEGKIAASGNVQTLLKADGSRTDAPDYCYNGLFFNCKVLTTSPTLQATTLGNYCYQSAFSNCFALATAPALPATTLGNYCYQSMFQGCSVLTTAPVLPATTLATGCYNYMFRYCTKLTSAPVLPATTLVNSCYNGMFFGCSVLTTAPVLPATTLANSCYNQMFQNCTLLNLVEVAFTTWTTATTGWLGTVAAEGTFKCPTALGTNETITRGYSNCPEGWTVVNTDAA